MARPSSVEDAKTMQLRLPGETLNRVEGWRRVQEEIPSRSEAIRRLLDIGLDAESAKAETPDAA